MPKLVIVLALMIGLQTEVGAAVEAPIVAKVAGSRFAIAVMTRQHKGDATYFASV